MMTYRVSLTSFLAIVLLLWSATPGFGQGSNTAASEIRERLETRDQEIKAILNGSDESFTSEQRARLKELINGVIDFKTMARTALGPHWDDLTPEKQKEFADTFRDVVRAQSMSDLGVYNSEVTYDQIDVQNDSAFVRTRTKYEGRTTPVDYVLNRRNGKWLAEDIVIDGVSTAEGYARSFQNIIRKHGFETLMKSLKKKQDSAASTATESGG